MKGFFSNIHIYNYLCFWFCILSKEREKSLSFGKLIAIEDEGSHKMWMLAVRSNHFCLTSLEFSGRFCCLCFVVVLYLLVFTLILSNFLLEQVPLAYKFWISMLCVILFPYQLCLVVVAAATAKSLQSCSTLCDPIDGSPPGSPVPGILQARTLSGLPFPSPMHESEKWTTHWFWGRPFISYSKEVLTLLVRFMNSVMFLKSYFQFSFSLNLRK